jgi:hypothetical protein
MACATCTEAVIYAWHCHNGAKLQLSTVSRTLKQECAAEKLGSDVQQIGY